MDDQMIQLRCSYCHGVVSGDECGDNTAWTPGTFCTQSDLVCWESEED